VKQEPAAQRVDGGTSPRLAALVASGLLITVVLIGISGRTPAAERDPAPAAVARPSVGLLPDSTHMLPGPLPPITHAATEAPRSTPFVMPTSRPARSEEIVVHVTVGGQHLVGFLNEGPAGQFRGIVRLGFPRPARAGILQLVDLTDDDAGTARIGRFTLPLDPLIPETTRSGTVIELSVAAQPDLEGGPRLVREGYHLSVRAEGRRDFALIRVRVLVGAGP
jgi:hypothetical protein